nr:sensor histidine kinase [uncultured Lachnoanaerobaculum sp.]
MKSIGYLKINTILDIMLCISIAAMMLTSGFIWIVTERIVSLHEAKLFLSNAVNVPGNTLHIFIFTLISSVCFILTFCLRNSDIAGYTKVVFITFVIEFVLGLICIVLLNFNYNGILLWTFANALMYLKRNKYMSIVVVIAMISYLLTTHELVKLFINIFDISSYIKTCSQNLQTFIYFIYNVLNLMTVVCFILCCIIIIVSKEEIIEKNLELNKRLEIANTDLQRTNEELEKSLKDNARLAEIKERNRIAREIHDTLGHTLTGLAAGIDACIALAGDEKTPLRNQLDLLSKVSRNGIKDIRMSVSSLRPDATERLNLKKAIEELVENTKKISGVNIKFDCDADILKFDEDEETAIYRIVQESLTNAIRHGNAKNIDVLIKKSYGSIGLLICDDGIGCEKLEAGFGLRHIRERVNMLKGQVSFSSDKGFKVEAMIPIRWGEEYD